MVEPEWQVEPLGERRALTVANPVSLPVGGFRLVEDDYTTKMNRLPVGGQTPTAGRTPRPPATAPLGTASLHTRQRPFPAERWPGQRWPGHQAKVDRPVRGG